MSRPTPLQRAVRTWLTQLDVERGVSAHTLSAYARDAGRYLDHLAAAGVIDPGEVTEQHVSAFLAALRTGDADHPPLAASSAARTLVAVRGLHKFLALEGLTDHNPAEDVAPPSPPSRLPKAIRLDEVTRLIDAAGVGDGPMPLRDRALLELLYGTGARISEVVGLDIDDLDLRRLDADASRAGDQAFAFAAELRPKTASITTAPPAHVWQDKAHREHWSKIDPRRVPISNVDLTLDLDRGRLSLSPFTFAMARGNVAADSVFDTRARPSDVRYDIRLAPTPLGRLLAGWGVAEAGTSGTVRGRIQLAGRGDTIHDSLSTARGRIAFVLPAGTLWTRNAELAELDIGTFLQKMFSGALKEPVKINCGLIGFTVRGGVAAADPILIDTSKNVVLGRGGFSFRTEAVDLAFRADSKKFSLFSGQSPVGIRGTFATPGLQVITPQLVTRAGAGLGLAVLATPVAGLLAFIDPGDAKAAACGPVLAGKTAAAQRTTKGEPRDDVGDGQAAPKKRKKFLGIF